MGLAAVLVLAAVLTPQVTSEAATVAGTVGEVTVGAPVTRPVVEGGWVPIAPFRLMDTRSMQRPSSPTDDPGSVHPLAAHEDAFIPVYSTLAGIRLPRTGVRALVVNVTVTRTTSAGFLTLHSWGSSRPPTSALNWAAGETRANLAVVPLGTVGALAVGNTSDAPVDVVVDTVGYVLDGPASQAGALTTSPPTRLLDTRLALGIPTRTPLAPGSTTRLRVVGRAGVPTTGVSAVLVTLTSLSQSADGYLTAWAGGTVPRPTASTMNWARGRTVANTTVVPVAPDGTITLLNASVGTTHLIADLTGWVRSGTTVVGGLAPASPRRALDTRIALGVGGRTPLAGGTTTRVRVLGGPGLPAAGATAVTVTLTATAATTAGYLTAWAGGGATRPTSSSLNWATGQTVANTALVPVAADGTISLYVASPGRTHLVVDVTGGVVSRAATAHRFTSLPLTSPVPSVRPEVGAMGMVCPEPDACVGVGSVTGPGDSWTPRALLFDVRGDTVTSSLADTGDPDASSQLNTVGCSSVQHCVAASRDAKPPVLLRSEGAWRRVALPVPAGVPPTLQWALTSAACPSSTRCLVVGTVSWAQADLPYPLRAPVVVTIDGTRVSAALVPGATPTLNQATVTGLTCPSPTWCAALEVTAVDRSVLVLDGDVWTMSTLPRPTADLTGAFSCSAPGECTALVGGKTSVLVDRLSAGRVTTTNFTPPRGATAMWINVYGLSCASVTQCVATGMTVSSEYLPEPWVLDLGRDMRMREAALAPFACPAAGADPVCVAGGDTFSTYGGESWTSETLRTAEGEDLSFGSPLCTSPDACVIVAASRTGGVVILRSIPTS